MQEVLTSINTNERNKTKAIILHYNVIVTTNNLLFAMRSMLLCIRGRRGNNLNQEEMNVANDMEMSESLFTGHKQ